MKGYKDNHVKCSCSEGKLHTVRTQLKMLTGKEVSISKLTIENACLLHAIVTYSISHVMYNNAEYLDEEHREERAIQYLVKHEVGALASTLEVVSVSSLLDTQLFMIITIITLSSLN